MIYVKIIFKLQFLPKYNVNRNNKKRDKALRHIPFFSYLFKFLFHFRLIIIGFLVPYSCVNDHAGIFINTVKLRVGILKLHHKFVKLFLQRVIGTAIHKHQVGSGGLSGVFSCARFNYKSGILINQLFKGSYKPSFVIP